MSESRFDKAFAQFFQSKEAKITPKTFFHVLEEMERERVPQTIELTARSERV